MSHHYTIEEAEKILRYKQEPDSDGRWITVQPSGSHLFVGKGGEIDKGPEGLKGKSLGEVDSDKQPGSKGGPAAEKSDDEKRAELAGMNMAKANLANLNPQQLHEIHAKMTGGGKKKEVKEATESQQEKIRQKAARPPMPRMEERRKKLQDKAKNKEAKVASMTDEEKAAHRVKADLGVEDRAARENLRKAEKQLKDEIKAGGQPKEALDRVNQAKQVLEQAQQQREQGPGKTRVQQQLEAQKPQQQPPPAQVQPQQPQGMPSKAPGVPQDATKPPEMGKAPPAPVQPATGPVSTPQAPLTPVQSEPEGGTDGTGGFWTPNAPWQNKSWGDASPEEQASWQKAFDEDTTGSVPEPDWKGWQERQKAKIPEGIDPEAARQLVKMMRTGNNGGPGGRILGETQGTTLGANASPLMAQPRTKIGQGPGSQPLPAPAGFGNTHGTTNPKRTILNPKGAGKVPDLVEDETGDTAQPTGAGQGSDGGKGLKGFINSMPQKDRDKLHNEWSKASAKGNVGNFLQWVMSLMQSGRFGTDAMAQVGNTPQGGQVDRPEESKDDPFAGFTEQVMADRWRRFKQGGVYQQEGTPRRYSLQECQEIVDRAKAVATDKR